MTRSEIRALHLEFWDYSNRRLGVLLKGEAKSVGVDAAWEKFEKYFDLHPFINMGCGDSGLYSDKRYTPRF